MKNPVTLLLAVAVAVLGAYGFSQTRALQDQQRQLSEARERSRDLDAKLAAKAASDSLDLQGRCARQAAEAFRTFGLDKSQSSSYTSHYSQKLGKCFIKTYNMSTFGKTVWTYMTLVDAFELKDYGDYAWHTVENKRFWEVPPLMCKVTSLSGEQTICRSAEEFEALVKEYMER